MNRKNIKLHPEAWGSAIHVRIQPRASQNEVVDILDDGTVKIRITSAPTDGKANEMLIKFLAGVFHCPTSDISIIAGHSSKDKLIGINGLDSEKIDQILKGLVKNTSDR
jgi:hypothetical protein